MPGPARHVGTTGQSQVTSAASLLSIYDLQLRGAATLQTTAGLTIELEGPIVRASSTTESSGMVMATGLDHLTDRDWDQLIRAQVSHFQDLGQPFEWKTFSHDHPQDFLRRLECFGFSRGDAEAVMVAPGQRVADEPGAVPPGIEVFRLRTGSDFQALAEELGQAFGEAHDVQARAYELAVAAFPESVFVLGARTRGELVASGRLELVAGSDFGTLWGGSVVPSWRHRGLYRALVTRRAQLALEAGFSLLEVDALPSSQPILERLGFAMVTATVPYTWAPPAP